jgi:hypothetical protein
MPNTGNHYDQSTDKGSNDRDIFSGHDQNEVGSVVLQVQKQQEALIHRILDVTIRVKDNSNELTLAIRSIHGRAKMYAEAEGGDLELLLQIQQ